MKSYRNLLLATITSLIFCLNSFGQQRQNQSLIIQTPIDDAAQFLTPINQDQFLLTTVRGEIISYPDEVNAFYSYTNIVYLISPELELLDSLVFYPVQGYGTRLNKIIPLSEELFVAGGEAYDSITGDHQVYLCWFDAQLDVIRDTLMGSPDLKENPLPIYHNSAGKLVQYGGYLGNGGGGIFNYFYYELASDGAVLQFYTDTSSMSRFFIESIGSQGKYLQYGGDCLIRLNADFSLDSIIELNGNLDVAFRDFSMLSDTTFFIGGNYFIPNSPPGGDLDFDPAFIPIGVDGQVYPVVHYGAVDTMDSYSALRVYPEGLFLAGTKNLRNGPISSWCMTHKLDENYDLIYTATYGEGVHKYFMNDVIPTPEGGCIVSITRWDFEHFPDEEIQHDIVVVRYDANGQLVSTIELPAPPSTKVRLAPNPVANQVQIMDEQHCWQFAELFDQQGKLIAKKRIINCRNINISDIKAGLYLIRLSNSSGKSAVARLVKE